MNFSERSSSTGFVDDLLHRSLGVSLSVGIVKSLHLRGTLSQLGVRTENGSRTFSLSCVRVCDMLVITSIINNISQQQQLQQEEHVHREIDRETLGHVRNDDSVRFRVSLFLYLSICIYISLVH